MDVDAPPTGQESPSPQTTASYARDYSSYDENSHDASNNARDSEHMQEDPQNSDSRPYSDEGAVVDENMPTEEDEAAQLEDLKRSRLANARAALQQPDSILEMDVFANIKTMFESGGLPQEIIKFLGGSYRGYPQMCNLVSNWLRRAKVPENEIAELSESHIRNEIKSKFDPIKAARIFEMGSAPSWLSEMIMHSTWRHLIYELSEDHRDCLLLNYGIQKISEAGHEDEIAALPSASTYFSVFNRVLAETVQKALNYPEWDLASALSDFKRMCRHSEHTFIYTQAVLHSLFSSDPTGRIRRISEELATSPPPKIDPGSETVTDSETEEQQLFFRSSLLFMSNLGSFTPFASPYMSIMRSSYPSPGDVRAIHTAYTQQPDPSMGAFGPPPANFLHNPIFLDKLIAALFSTQPEVPSDFINSYAWLLSYASVSTDTRQILPSTPLESALPSSLANETLLKSVSEAILKVVAACKNTSVGLSMNNALETILAHVEYSMVGVLALFWVRYCICDPEKAPSSWGARFLSAQLEVLQEVAATHHLLQPHCLSLLMDALAVETTMDPSTASAARKRFMEYAAFLVEHGHVLPVLQKIEYLAQSVDQSLIRHFLVIILEMVAPPFSIAFLDPVARLLSKVKIDVPEQRNIVTRFTREVLKSGAYKLSLQTSASINLIHKSCSN